VRYKITRHYFCAKINKRVIATGLILADAQSHCCNPESSSRTATSYIARARTRKLGPWFDSYSEE